ncbi:DUF4270 domain-containing protein [Dysgonomonas macrotermitis]|uniref:DUF4270 domain-containing protein n=1 Tax=Dysgonomonas macrotermitis TaxID=1346286 RepID=A0A1M5G2K9_9BACT|nr:DUF4270 domain-containing protein [Dysgonomonas macrotermitis]SHF98040.1 protein of unknown function [Dysgonomonas macrotermitis]
MKLSTLLSLAFALSITFGFISCDDNLNDIGGSLQPPSDLISVGTDTLAVSARTISMQDSVFAQTINGILGNYEDDIFGTTKSDYLCQLYFPKDTKFKEDLLAIDSVQFVIDYASYIGDSLAPMGLSVYKVTKELPEYFYTNADPKKYTDMKSTIASQAFSVAGSKITEISSGVIYRQVIAEMDTSFGNDLYSAMKAGTVTDDVSFNKYFPGMYVTTTFGSGTLIQALQTTVDIYYRYKTPNFDNTTDTIIKGTLSLAVTKEVNQLNRVENKNPESLFDTSSGMIYSKTPAGVYPEVVLPIKQIKQNMVSNNFASVNSAMFSVTGYTEKEPTGAFSYGRSQYLLLVNKDSVDYFFKTRSLPNSITTFTAERNTSTNTYKFGNLSRLISIYKDKNLEEDPTFVLVPVDLSYIQASIYSNPVLVNVYNKMLPTASIFRNNVDNMRLTLIYTRF